MRQPVPRPKIYDMYWYFASERQAIFERRVADDPGPWTEDSILSHFKFCNVFRASDRVSQFLIRDVAYHGEGGQPEDRLFQIVAFRLFSRVETWRTVVEMLGRQPLIEDLRSGDFLRALEMARKRNRRLYTGAFILCANDAYGMGLKHLNHVALLQDMFVQGELGQRLLDEESLRDIYDLLHTYPLIGDFMAYQLAIDLNYSSLLNFSENEFTQPGPGAVRGLRKAFTSLGGLSPAETILWMVEHQDREFKRLGLEFKGLWGRPLKAIDCQGLFCELDKYCRVAAPELASQRTRIKARFKASDEPLSLFYPPKWAINDALPSSPVLGSAHQDQQLPLAAKPGSETSTPLL